MRIKEGVQKHIAEKFGKFNGELCKETSTNFKEIEENFSRLLEELLLFKKT